MWVCLDLGKGRGSGKGSLDAKRKGREKMLSSGADKMQKVGKRDE